MRIRDIDPVNLTVWVFGIIFGVVFWALVVGVAFGAEPERVYLPIIQGGSGIISTPTPEPTKATLPPTQTATSSPEVQPTLTPISTNSPEPTLTIPNYPTPTILPEPYIDGWNTGWVGGEALHFDNNWGKFMGGYKITKQYDLEEFVVYVFPHFPETAPYFVLITGVGDDTPDRYYMDREYTLGWDSYSGICASLYTPEMVKVSWICDRTPPTTPTLTPTPTPTLTPTPTPTPTQTFTPTLTSTPTLTPTMTPTQTFTPTPTQTQTPTQTFTPTLTPTPTPTQTQTPNPYAMRVIEINPGVASDYLDDWVTIQNTGVENIDIDQWTLWARSSGYQSPHLFGKLWCPDPPEWSTIIAPGATVKVISGYGSDTQDTRYWCRAYPVWAWFIDIKGSVCAQLEDKSGTLISEVCLGG